MNINLIKSGKKNAGTYTKQIGIIVLGEKKLSPADKRKRMLRRMRLKSVFEATEEYCKTAGIDKQISTKKLQGSDLMDGSVIDFFEQFAQGQKEFPKTKLAVDNRDCVLVAKDLSLQGKTCVLNMANANTPGGGVRNGAMAQEEELCRRSNLIFGLKPKMYPLADTEFLYTKNIRFIKDGNYKMNHPEDWFKCDVVTVAAPCLIPFKGKKKPKGYTKLVDEKIAQMLLYPATQGVKNLVLSAFGCGAFRNNPRFISQRFKKQLQYLPYDNIVFAILDDHNALANGISNYQTFKKTIKS